MTSDGCFSAGERLSRPKFLDTSRGSCRPVLRAKRPLAKPGFPVASVPADVLQPPVQQALGPVEAWAFLACLCGRARANATWQAQTGDVQGQEAGKVGSGSQRASEELILVRPRLVAPRHHEPWMKWDLRAPMSR